MRQLSFLTTAAAAAIAAGPLPAQAQSTFVTYHCRDGTEFVAGFYRGDSRVHLQLDGKAIALAKRVALDGSRYVKGDITLRIGKNGATTLKRGKRTTECSAD